MEEELYWKNFHFAQFSIILPSHFLHHLKLPKKFSDYMRSIVPDKVVLKVHGVAWNVNLVKHDEHVMFKGREWQEFAKAYSLKEADMLVCKYNRRECFDIMLFDRENSCEIEASYFVRKSEKHPECSSEYGDQSNEEGHDVSTELTRRIPVDSDEDGDSAPRNKKKKSGTVKGSSSVQAACITDYTSDDESNQSSDIEERQCTTPKRVPSSGVNQVPSNSQSKRKYRSARRTARKSSMVSYKSNRRPVTGEETQKTLDLALQKSEEHKNSFVVVMRPTSVYRRFFLTIPREWRPKSVFRKGQTLILRVRDKSWLCAFNLGIQGGWKKFVSDNFLEEYDVCLFTPAGLIDGTYVFDVSIFRVVPEVVPPTLVTS